MISRRHIRIKVMQSLYSFFSVKDTNVSNAEKKLLDHIENINVLHNVLICFLIELCKFAENHFEDGKNKFLPSPDDLNPNTKFTENFIFKLIRKDKKLLDKLKNVSSNWLDNDHDIIRKVFIDLIKSDLYNKYILKESSQEEDIRFINQALNNFILNNEVLHHILEEKSIYWIDDLPFVATIIMGNFKLNKINNLKTVFKNSSDKSFAVNLFSSTVEGSRNYEKIIVEKSKNWDLERIALMDQILIKMAFSEILTMEDLPVKVSLNEYIEISKYYSTSKSKMFVNGLLDNAIKEFNEKNMINKKGRGLQ